MKKLLFLIIPVILLSACKEDKTPVPYSILAEETTIDMVGEGQTYKNRIYTNSPTLDVVIADNAKEWLSAKMEDGFLVVTVGHNPSIGGRNSTIRLNGIDCFATVQIRQGGLPTKSIGIVDAEASSVQTLSGNESIFATYDGDDDTFWHTQYGMTQDVFWALWYLAPGASSIDLVYLLPRQYPDPTRIPNGRFTHFGIWVKGDGTGTETLDPDDTDDTGKFDPNVPVSGWGGRIGSVDSDGFKLVYKGNAEMSADAINAVILPVDNPVQVKVKFAGTAEFSRGGFLSLAEVKFSGRVG